MENTEYNKEYMYELSSNIQSYTNRYAELVSTLGSKITEMGSYWIDNDADAAALYETLKSNYSTFEKQLKQGEELMKSFQATVDGQISGYSDAESTIYKVL